MNYFNDYALEELAMRVVRSYLNVCGEDEKRRIVPKVLCEKVLGLRVLNTGLSPDGSILGMTSFGKAKANIIDEDNEWSVMPLDGKTVLIEKAMLDNPCCFGRYNFTVAHEASHHIFRMIQQDSGNEKNRLLVQRSLKYTTVEFEEWQTDRLAAAILMNKPMLRNAMKEAGIPDGIKVLDDRIPNDTWSAFCRTAEILGVSLTALEIRMTKLGLIDRNIYHTRHERTSILDVC